MKDKELHQVGWVQTAAVYIKRFWFVAFIILTYVLMVWYYMGPSVTHCGDTVYGFGDNTAGPIWKYSVSPQESIIGNLEHSTNFPFGESLYSPVGYSLIAQSTAIWGLEKTFGPICGYNMVNIIGFLATALLMAGLVFWLTKNRWVAWLSGYLFSFAPYFQYKVGGHPSYGYAALLIGALWLFLKLLRYRRRRDSVWFALIVGLNFYWDPYFSLLVSSLITPMVIAWLVVAFIRRKSPENRQIFKMQFRRLLLSAILIVVAILPLVFIQVSQSAKLNAYVSGTRGDVMADAKTCSILPWDYFLPSNDNYFLQKFVYSGYSTRISQLHHGCNPSEYTVGISYAVMTITMLGIIVFAWELLNRRKLKLEFMPHIIKPVAIVGLICVIIFAGLLALPPKIGGLILPSDVLLHLTQTWRILARLYVVISIAFTVLFAITLVYFGQNIKMRKGIKIAFFVLITLSIVLQYQAFKPFSGSRVTFSYSKDTPSIYYWVSKQTTIHSIAAFPLDKVGESEAPSYYLSFQTITKKPLFNSTLAFGPQDALRYSLKDLMNPQTIPVLRELGIDTIEVHGLSPAELSTVPGIAVLKYQSVVNSISGGEVAFAHINPGPKAAYATVLLTGFPINGEVMKSPVDFQYEVQQNAKIKVANVRGRDTGSSPQNVCFDIKMADPLDSDSVQVMDGKTVLVGPTAIGKDYVHLAFVAPANHVLTIRNSQGHNMRMDMIGCEL